MFWHNRSHVNLYPSGPIHKCYFNMKYPSLYCAWFVESCQTSPSKRIKRNFGIVKKYLCLLYFCIRRLKEDLIWFWLKRQKYSEDSTRPCHDRDYAVHVSEMFSLNWETLLKTQNQRVVLVFFAQSVNPRKGWNLIGCLIFWTTQIHVAVKW